MGNRHDAAARPVLEDFLDGLTDMSRLSRRRREVMEAELQASWDYEPKTYQGQLTLFRVRSLPLLYPGDPEMGWGKLATGGVRIEILPGTHYSLLHQPSVQALAVHLKSALNQAPS